MTLRLKLFRLDGCISYVIHDSKTSEGIAIDPSVGLMDDFREFIADHQVKIRWALDTHIHADHFSATHLIRAEYGAEIAMSVLTRSQRPTRRLESGDRLEFGSFFLEALATPGHTPDGMCYTGAGLVFTGDTLFIGSSGRTDFPGADPSQQWKSLNLLTERLPGETVVLPGHDYNDLLFSTIAVEKGRNPHLRMPSEREFVELKKSEMIPNPSEEVLKRVEFNSSLNPSETPVVGVGGVTACGVATALGAGQTGTINVEKYQAKLKDRKSTHAFIDVREPDEFTAGHMPGAQNIPLSEVALHWQELSKFGRIYVSCLSGRRSGMAAKTLSYLGMQDVVNVLGGYKAWTQASLPVESGK